MLVFHKEAMKNMTNMLVFHKEAMFLCSFVPVFCFNLCITLLVKTDVGYTTKLQTNL